MSSDDRASIRMMQDCDARAEPLVDAERARRVDGRAGLAPGAPIAVERITTGHSNEVFRVDARGAACACCAGRRARRCRRPRTTWRASSGCCARVPRLARDRSRARADRAVHRRRRDRRALLSDGRRRRCRRARAAAGAARRRSERAARVRVRARSTRSPASTRSTGSTAASTEFGKPDGYLERQVPRWLGQLERYKTRPLPEVDDAGRWLAAHTPPMQPPAVIHGDYKLDNVMFAPRAARSSSSRSSTGSSRRSAIRSSTSAG